MKVRDLAVETWSAFDANRGRSALTVLGIFIGIAAVISMTALIGGINRALVSELGLNQAQLVSMGIYTGASITYDDVNKIGEDLASDYEYVLGTSNGSAEVTTGTKKASGQITGVTPVYFKANNIKFLQGRAFTDAEESGGVMVAILDKNGVKTLFGDEKAEVVGKTINLNNNSVTIVGVTEPTNGFYYGEDSVSLFMPFSTCAARITGTRDVTQIQGFAHEGSDMEQVVSRTQEYIYAKYCKTEADRDSVWVQSMQSMIDSVNSTMSAFSLLMTVVASVSLLVGGIGIMNMMLTNVTERIREIGLRKALGARRSDITKQFILESVCLCVTGGLFGVLFGYLGAFGLAQLGGDALLGEGSGMQVTPYIDGGTVLMATGICIFIGVLFGWYPAYRAARLDPVESLHYQ